MNNASHRRRWFQFGLRTLFVSVTIFAVWLGWELKFIRERAAFLNDWNAIYYGGLMTGKPHLTNPNGPISFWRRMLGDKALIWITLHRDNVDGIARAKKLFPEAEVNIVDNSRIKSADE